MKHIVMWKLADGADKMKNMQKIKEGLEGLNGKITGMRAAQVGINQNTSDMAFDVVLVSDFDSAQALAAYQENPLHLEVASFVRSVAVERHVVDYEA